MQNASFVQPPVHEMNNALNEFEKFMSNTSMIRVLHADILHAQFETIHPFLDGNGRTGRLLITLFLFERAILEKPALFLSSFFKNTNSYTMISSMPIIIIKQMSGCAFF